MTMTDEPNDPIRLEDLVAHAEGRLPAGSTLRARVEEHLRHNPGDAARVDAYRHQDHLLHEAFDDIARQPLPPRLQERLAQPQLPQQPRLALAASLVIGIAVGWLVAQIEQAPEGGDGGGTLAEQAAERLTGTEDGIVRADESAGEREREHGIVDTGAVDASATSEKLLPEGTPDLSSIGLTATGNMALEDPAAGLRRYEYRDTSGSTLQLMVTRDRMVDPASVYTLQNGDFSLAYWHQGDNTYVLSGAIKTDRLQSLAHDTMAALEPDAPQPIDDGDSSDSEVMAGSGKKVGNGKNTTVEEVAEPMPVIDKM